MPYTGTVPTFLAGELPDADKFTEITNFMNAMSGALTDYSASFTITGSTTSPTKGSSTYSAGYRRVGKYIEYELGIVVGAGFSAGSGSYSYSVPVTASAGSFARATGAVWINDSGTALRMGVMRFNTTTALQIYMTDTASIGLLATLGSAGPGTAWATNDSFIAKIIYEAA